VAVVVVVVVVPVRRGRAEGLFGFNCHACEARLGEGEGRCEVGRGCLGAVEEEGVTRVERGEGVALHFFWEGC
jgi:hypothetical protein